MVVDSLKQTKLHCSFNESVTTVNLKLAYEVAYFKRIG